MKRLLLSALIALGGSQLAFGQDRPDLGTNPANFILFTSAGALTNEGASRVTGNIGTNEGEYTGFTAPGVLTGNAEVENVTSLATAQEMPDVYNSFPAGCDASLTTPLGGVVPIGPGIYCTTGAASIPGDIILDADSDPDAIFIFKINGALSTSTGSRVVLINGATLENVYWQVLDAVSLGGLSVFRGTIVAGGAIDLAEGAALLGRALTTAGAISLHNNRVSLSESALPVTLSSFNVKATDARTVLLSWSTTLEVNSDRFEIERSANGKRWENIGVINSAGESKNLSSYTYTDESPLNGSNLYRLKMVDRDLSFAYSRIRSVEVSGAAASVMFPNPVVTRVNLLHHDMSNVGRIQINNMSGIVVYDDSKKPGTNLSEAIDMTGLPNGIYMAKVISLQGKVSVHKLVKL